MKRAWWPWILLALAVVAVAAIGLRAALGVKVGTAVARLHAVVQTVVASGRVSPPAQVRVGSVVVGRVVAVPVDEGRDVTTGEPLVLLADAEVRATVGQAEAALAQATARISQLRSVGSRVASETLKQAEASLAQAEADQKRAETLFQASATQREQFDRVRTALDLARSQRDSARLQVSGTGPGGADARIAAAAEDQARELVEAARARLDQTRITAPCDGRILARTVEPGDVVQPGQALLTVGRAGGTQLVIQPDEKNLALLREGQSAIASADAFPGHTFKAVVRTIAPAVDRLRGTIEVKLDVPAAPEFLRPDMTVSVEIEVARRESVLVVPEETVREAGSAHPWVLAAVAGHAERRAIRLGLRGQGVVEVEDGLAEGDVVILPSSGPVQSGARIRM